MAERVVYSQVIEALLDHGLKGMTTPRVLAQLAALGVDRRQPLAPQYPISVWGPCLVYLAKELSPASSEEEALKRLGERFVEGYQQTLAGKAVFGLAKVVGPDRTITRVASSFRSGNNYVEARVTKLGPGTYDVWMNEELRYQPYVSGLIRASMRCVGAEGATVHMRDRAAFEFVMEVRW